MINRNVAFWDDVASHPEVAPHIFLGMEPQSLSILVDDDRNLCLASENGGCIFVSLDHLGQVWEMHTMYKPEGWGREVARAGKAFIAKVFECGSVILTYEQEGNWRSVPPKSHGWKAAADYCAVGLPKRLKMWILTREAWSNAPVNRRLQCR